MNTDSDLTNSFKVVAWCSETEADNGSAEVMNGFNALKYRFDGRSITPPKRYPSVTSDAVKTPTIKTVNMPKTIMGFRFLVVTLLNF